MKSIFQIVAILLFSTVTVAHAQDDATQYPGNVDPNQVGTGSPKKDDASAGGNRDNHKTQLMALKFIAVEEMVEVTKTLRLTSDDLTIVASPRTNSLVVKGSDAGIAALQSLVDQLDQPVAKSQPSSQQRPIDETRGPASRAIDAQNEVIVQLKASGKALVKEREPSNDELKLMLGKDTQVVVDLDPKLDAKTVESFIERLGKMGVDQITFLSPQASMPALDELQRGAAEVALRGQYEAAERLAAQLALRWRDENKKTNSDSEQLKKLESDLEIQVRKSFQLRQRWQRQQIENHRLRLLRLSERIERREKIANRIVERRIDELQSGEDLSWLAPPEKDLAPAAPAPWEHVSTAERETSKAAAKPLTEISGDSDFPTLTINARSAQHASQITERLEKYMGYHFKPDEQNRFKIRERITNLQTAEAIVRDIDRIANFKSGFANASDVPIYLFAPTGTKAQWSFGDITIPLPGRFKLDAGDTFVFDLPEIPALGDRTMYAEIKIPELSNQAKDYFKEDELRLAISIADMTRARYATGEAMTRYVLVQRDGELRVESDSTLDPLARDAVPEGELVAELAISNARPRLSNQLSRSQRVRGSVGKKFTPHDSVVFVELIVSPNNPSKDNPAKRKAIYMDGTVVGNEGLVAIVIDDLIVDGSIDVDIEAVTIKTYTGKAIHDARIVIHDFETGIALLQSGSIPVPALNLRGPRVVASQGVEIFGRGSRRIPGLTEFEQQGWQFRSQVSSTSDGDDVRFSVHMQPQIAGSAVTLVTTGQLVGIMTTQHDSNQPQDPRAKVVPVDTIDQLVQRFRKQDRPAR